MPATERSTTLNATRAVIWDFVKDMDNWAPFLRGYQSHRRVSDSESIWLLKGNLGGLTRVAEFRVLISEWAGPDRVRFQLQGLNEPMSGAGAFHAVAATPNGATAIEPRPAPTWRLLWDNFWRAVLHTIMPGSAPAAKRITSAPAQTTVTFELSLSVAGPSGKIIDLLMAPLLAPVAEELLAKIANAIDGRATSSA